MSERTIFTPCDVFISWNNQDRELKDKIVEIIRQSGHSVWESDYECTGSIKDACLGHIPLCKTFLILLTHNSINSHWVKDELEVALAMEGAPNRMIPLVMDAVLMDRKVLQQTVLSGTIERLFFNEDEGMNVSAIVADSMENEDAFRNKLIKNIEDLCLNRCYHDYVASLQNVSITIPMLSKKNTIAAYADLHDLYIPRILKKISFGNQGAESCEDEQGLTETEFLNQRENSVIIGTGGSGKSQYLNQITAMACSGENLLVFPVRCTAFMRKGQHLKNYLYDFFTEKAKNTTYKQTHFDALLDRKKDKLLLLLDGIDEIITENDFWVFRRTVENFLSEYPQSRVVFTTRNQRDADRLVLNSKPTVQYWLDPFTQSDIHKYTQQLFLAFGNEVNGEQFYMDISSIDDEIKCNPLLISQLAVIYANSGKLPQTIVEIFDIITEIVTTGIDSRHYIDAGFPTDERFLISWIPGILREMAYSKFEKYALEEKADNIGLVSDILQKNLGQSVSPLDCRSKAERILDYLDRRAILYQDEFAHKMFLEYFTAVHLYEECFDGKGNIRNEEMLTEYFCDHYHDSYWITVTELFLSKADHKCSQKGMARLYQIVCKYNDGNYDLLFRMCKVFSRRTAVKRLLLRDIMERTLSREYSAYGQLFCYVPRENLYDIAVTVASEMWGDIQQEKRFIMLSLLRDVCYIFGGFTSLEDVAKDQRILRQFRNFAKQQSESPRGALNAMFCGVKPAWLDAYVESQTASPVYPFYFNVHAVATTDGKGFGKYPLTQVFEDELGLYGQTDPDDHGRYWGLVSLPYCKDALEYELQFEYADGMTGLILLPSEERTFEALNICNAKLELLMLPSSITELGNHCFAYYGISTGNGIRVLPEYGISIIAREHSLMHCKKLRFFGIPNSVTKLGDWAFKDCKDLVTIQIPESVMAIGYKVFEDCIGLISAVIPHGVTETGYGMFSGCINLRDVVLPQGLVKIYQETFNGCANLSVIDIPQSVEEIRGGAFCGCVALSKIIIPANVTEIGNSAFAYCKNLQVINIPNSITDIWSNVFRKCINLKSIDIPIGVTKIWDSAFEGCANIRSIHVPDGVTDILSNAFSGCTSLTSLAIPDSVKIIWDGAFRNCTSLTSVLIPHSVTYIQKEAFAGCINLNIIDIQDQTQVEASAFDDCPGWQARQSTNLVKQASEGNLWIDRNLCPDGIARCPSEWERSERAKVDNVHISKDMNEIDNMAFHECRRLKEINIPDGVKRVGHSAFALCVSLESIILPNSIKEIGLLAFANCNNLQYVKLPCDITEIQVGLFSGCSRLKEIELPENVTDICDEAFKGCSSLASVVLPNRLDYLGRAAFMDCTSLNAIHIPSGLTYIAWEVFKGCTKMHKVIFPVGITKIGYKSFYACESLDTLLLPTGLKEIEGAAFKDCISLRTIEIPDGLTKIGGEAFEGCTNLVSIVIPESTREIGSGAFKCCASLSSVVVPQGITEIEDETFASCVALEEIVIPSSVTFISTTAFSGCHPKRVIIPTRFRDKISAIFGEFKSIELHKEDSQLLVVEF